MFDPKKITIIVIKVMVMIMALALVTLMVMIMFLVMVIIIISTINKIMTIFKTIIINAISIILSSMTG